RSGLTKIWPKSRRRPGRACESSTAARMKRWWTEPQSQERVGQLQIVQFFPTADGSNARRSDLGRLCRNRLESGSQVVDSGLLQIDGLVAAGLVELGAPYLVRALMLGWTKADGRSQPHVEIAHCF